MIPRISRLPVQAKPVLPIIVKSKYFTLLTGKNTIQRPRFHIVCKKRICKKAVDRNAARRRVYAALPKNIQPYDIRILLNKNISGVSYSELLSEVRIACKHLVS